MNDKSLSLIFIPDLALLNLIELQMKTNLSLILFHSFVTGHGGILIQSTYVL